MQYIERPAHADLHGIVRTYWWLRGAAQPGADPEPALPDGSPELIINLADPWEHVGANGKRTRQPAAFLVGQIRGPMVVRPTGRTDLVAVRLEAHAAAPLYDGVAALTDHWAPLARLRGRGLRELPRRLAADRTPEAQSRALDEALRATFAASPPDALVGGAVREIRRTNGAVEIDALARALAVTTRTLQRRFAAAAALSPKLLARIVRFQRVFAAWRDDPRSMSRVALACGYSDQSHLVRDFRDFAGAPPAGFLAALPAFTAQFTAARGETAHGVAPA